MKSDEVILKSMEALEESGPMALSKLADITGYKRDTLRGIIDRHGHRLVNRDASAMPAIYKVLPGWRERITAYFAERDRKRSEISSKHARKKPVVGVESDAKRAEKRMGTPQFKHLLAASVAIRPNVRTALRTPMPWQ